LWQVNINLSLINGSPLSVGANDTSLGRGSDDGPGRWEDRVVLTRLYFEALDCCGGSKICLRNRFSENRNPQP
jgi:hypothetical protein